MGDVVQALEASFAQVEGVRGLRPMLAGASEETGGFGGFLRTGAAVEVKSFSGVTGAEGGYAVPKEIDAVIGRALKAASPIRAIANVVKVGSAGYRKLVTTGGTPSGWAAEDGGHEARNAGWASARTRYDVGPGVRSEADVAALLAFFRARLGPARGFRLRDPFDAASREAGAPTPLDQRIGTGDGVKTRFALVKLYGEQARRITRPVGGSVRVAVGAIETAAFGVEPGGWVALDAAPAAGVAVTAGFLFDVPVRFAEDRLSVQRQTFGAGMAASVPLIELREDA